MRRARGARGRGCLRNRGAPPGCRLEEAAEGAEAGNPRASVRSLAFSPEGRESGRMKSSSRCGHAVRHRRAGKQSTPDSLGENAPCFEQFPGVYTQPVSGHQYEVTEHRIGRRCEVARHYRVLPSYTFDRHK